MCFWIYYLNICFLIWSSYSLFLFLFKLSDFNYYFLLIKLVVTQSYYSLSVFFLEITTCIVDIPVCNDNLPFVTTLLGQCMNLRILKLHFPSPTLHTFVVMYVKPIKALLFYIVNVQLDLLSHLYFLLIFNSGLPSEIIFHQRKYL